MSQQEQTRHYFDAWAGNWHAMAEGRADGYNVIEARHSAVLDVLRQRGPVQDFLDIGCGTGQLAITVAKSGIRSRGIDFAPEMIRLARKNNAEQNADAAFDCASFFDVHFTSETSDLVSAQGFIEYISLDQLDMFFGNCASLLRSGGSLALGSRNRLFNVVSLNGFTRLEMQLGTLEGLMNEAITMHGSRAEDLFANLAAHERIDAQPDHHPSTGINVDLRYQFSPADLIARGRRHGFVPNSIYPIHFQGVPVALQQQHLQFHRELARLMANVAPRDTRLVPYSSSFVLELRKS